MRKILEESIQRLLTDQVTPEAMRLAESGEWPETLWNLIEESGFTLATVHENSGGSGLSWPDVYPIIFAAGQHTLPLPLPETMLAAWLLDQAGMAIPSGPMTVVDSTGETLIQVERNGDGWQLSGTLHCVPWGRFAGYAVVEVELDKVRQFALIALAGLHQRHDLNLAREPRDTITLLRTAVIAMAPVPAFLGPLPIRFYGAMIRSAQMAGTMTRLVQQSVQYAGDRIQFGKAISKFQAIQQQLAVLGCECAATGAGAAFAFERAGHPDAQLAIAAGKTRASEAAGQTSSIAHATHGAIGFTYEHTLHFATRRLWSWRSEFGHAGWWARRIGTMVFNAERPFWEIVTGSEAIDLSIFPTNISTSFKATA